MQKRARIYLVALAALLCLLGAAGCSSPKTLEAYAQKNKVDFTSATVDIYYRQEMQGGEEIVAHCKDGEAAEFISALLPSVPRKEPVEASDETYCVPLSATHQIVLTMGDGTIYNFYYDQQAKYLTWEREITDNKGTRLEYIFFTPDEAAIEAITRKRAGAVSTNKAGADALDTDLVVLRASITEAMLQQEGDEIAFSPYDKTLPKQETEPNYHVYTSDTLDTLDEDTLLLVARGDESQQNATFAISKIVKTDALIRVVVDIQTPADNPDAPSDTSSASAKSVAAVGVVCDASNFAGNLPIVFVDGANDILGLQQLQ
nr:hypothetical protein [Maliibacterium massiliense]